MGHPIFFSEIDQLISTLFFLESCDVIRNIDLIVS